MGWFTRAISSSLGKKYIMALSGLFLVIYLVVHLFGNTFLYAGQEPFNNYVSALTESKFKYLIHVVEVILLLGFIIHIYDGIKLTIENWSARPNRYAVKPADPQSTVASRTMWLTASIVFFFLVVHIQQFWYSYHYGTTGEPNMYGIVVATFKDPLYSAIYLVSVFLLGFHLYHGFQSAFQSLGLNHPKYRPFIVIFGRIYAVVIALGFASFPIYFYFIYGR
ncbi:MAG: succinate dehydrogenase cytochrome b subunit [Bacillota bacterium]